MCVSIGHRFEIRRVKIILKKKYQPLQKDTNDTKRIVDTQKVLETNEITSRANKGHQKKKSHSQIDYQVEYHEMDLPVSNAATATFPRRLLSDPQVKIVEKPNLNPNPNPNANKLKTQLIAFFKRRPTADQLKQRGIIQGT
jgi:hypothetical protein